MEQLQHIISFSTHVAAINHIQSQSLSDQQWINYQIQQLQLLEKNQPNLQVFSTILKLDLDKYIHPNTNYIPVFSTIEIYHMLYSIPQLGIFTPTDNDQIQLRYLSHSSAYNNFHTSILMTYIANNPIICLIADSTVSILQIKDTYIHQLIQNSKSETQQPLLSEQHQLSTNKRQKNPKTYNTARRHCRKLSDAKYYYDNRKTISAKRKAKNNKGGIIQELNNNPNLDIDKLIQQKSQPQPVATTSIPTTTKLWTEVLDYQQAKTTLKTNIPTQHNRNNNKRKLEPTTTSTIQDFYPKKTKLNNDNKPP